MVRNEPHRSRYIFLVAYFTAALHRMPAVISWTAGEPDVLKQTKPPGGGSLPLPPGEGWGGGTLYVWKLSLEVACRSAPGVARQQVTFLVLPRKVTQRRRPRCAAPLRGFPALLAWSGGCGTRATRSDSPRRHPLTSLRYSAAHRGMKSERCGVRYAHGFCFVASVAHAILTGDGYCDAQPVARRWRMTLTNQNVPRG